MRLLHENLAARLLRRLANALRTHPLWFVVPQVILFAASIVYTSTHLRLSTDRNDLVSAEDRHRRNLIRFKQEFRNQDSLVAIVESADPERNRMFVERLAARLRREPELFRHVYYKGDLRLMGRKGLLFLPEPLLEQLRDTLVTNRALIHSLAQANSLERLLDQVGVQFRALASAPTNTGAREALAGALPSLQRMVQQATDSLQQSAVLPAPGVTALFGEGKNGSGLYLTFAGGRIFAVTAEAAESAVEPAAIRRLRELLEDTRQEIPGVNAGVTGEPVLRQDEIIQARRDTDKAALLSLFLSVFIFVYGYHEIRRPLMATVCLIVGLGYTLGIATLLFGRLNLLGLTLVPILIGIAIDFGVHLISRYEEELRRGSGAEAAMAKTLVFSGLGIVTSAITTAGAFLAMTLTQFKGIREMGVISGVGLLVCLIPMFTLLPLMLSRSRNETGTCPGADQVPRGRRRERFEQLYLRHPRTVLAVAALLTVFAISQLPRVRFDYNLLNLQTRDLPAVDMELKLIRSGSQSLLYAAVIAESLPEALQLEERIRALPSVDSVLSMARPLSEDATQKLALIREIRRETGSIALPRPDPNPADLPQLSKTVATLRTYLTVGLGRLGSEPQDVRLAAALRQLRDALERLAATIAPDDAVHRQRLTAFQQSLFKDLADTVETLRTQDDREGLRVEDLPPFLRDRYLSPNGRFFLQVFPKEDVWEREPQERFVRELRTVDPEVTGSPIQFYEYTSMLKESFQRAAGYSSAVIALFVLMLFRRPASVLLAFVPVLAGSLWTLGLMGALNIPFNPVNIMSLTLLIGIGVTNGIHILNRYAEEAHPSILSRSTGKAVLVSALTTMAGFGSLLISNHQGIASLGKVMLIGTGMCLVASLALLPVTLDLLGRAGWTMVRPRRPGPH